MGLGVNSSRPWTAEAFGDGRRGLAVSTRDKGQIRMPFYRPVFRRAITVLPRVRRQHAVGYYDLAKIIR